jgi:hypothetical protein
MKRIRISTFIILTLSLGVLLISIITQGSPILTTMASATTSATQEPTSSAAIQTGEDDYKLVISISYLATRKLTTPGIQSNPDEAIEKTKQQYR